MRSYEEELRRVEPAGRLLTRLALLGKSRLVLGAENIVRQGPSIIVGNHCGSYKDVAAVYLSIPRPLFFTSNQEIFVRELLDRMIRKHLRRQLKSLSGLVHFLVSPFLSLIVTYVSANMARVGAIPVDLYNHGKHEAIQRCVEYLRAGRAIVALQGRGRVVPSDPNPYVRAFSRGTSIIAYRMFDVHGIDVPVTPVALFGTQIPFLIPGKIRMSIGPPMFISGYAGGGLDATVARFKDALETTVKKLLIDIFRA
jgi:1-acyl-sn-glycerol-3-phosphate acyltransferase